MSALIQTLLLIAGCACLLPSVFGYSTGAGWNACENYMTPIHIPQGKDDIIEPQTTPSPYSVEVRVKANGGHTIRGGDKVEVTLSGADHFQGFILAAVMERPIGGKVEEILIGDFVSDDRDKAEKLTQTMCHGTAVTHTLNWRNSDYNSITFHWLAPEHNFTGEVTFHATFVKDYETFWVNVIGDQSAGLAIALPAVIVPPQNEENTGFGRTESTSSTSTTEATDENTGSTNMTSTTASTTSTETTSSEATTVKADSTTIREQLNTDNDVVSISSTSLPETTQESTTTRQPATEPVSGHRSAAVDSKDCLQTDIRCLKRKAVFGIHNLIMTLEKIKRVVQP